jgi:hypothetical protein
MRIDQWACAAVAAVALAALPGAVQLVASTPAGVERAPLSQERLGTPPAEIAIQAPEVLEGEVAQPTAPAPTFASHAVAADGEVFALLVGIDDYPGGGHDLRSAVADVDTMDAALDGFGVPAGNRVVLRDGQATRAQVAAAVRSLVVQGGPGATYVFGFAGHVRKLDSNTEALVLADGGVLRDSELAALLAPATTQHMWVVIAGCFGGGFTEVLAPGRVLTAASGADELAWEDPRLNASYLVHYLIREAWLQGKAGASVQEAFAYADATLAQTRPDRRPVQIDDAGGPLLLGLGDPAQGAGRVPALPAPSRPAEPSSSPSSSRPPTTTRPTEDDDEPSCVLGVVLCG